jgi:hypothetical protein
MKDPLLLAGIAVGVILMGAIVAVISRTSAWREMDWNQDGSTSFEELFAASDIGEQSVMIDGEECIEHFAYKDGLPVRTDCPSGRRAPTRNRER